MPSRIAPQKDLFPKIRTDEQLRELVFEVARRSAEPFRLLVESLSGQRVGEDEARKLWGAFVGHRRELTAMLGRPVHLRVAALDWLTQKGGGKGGQPLLLGQDALERLWRAATTDPLTGLFNRRHLEATIAHELRQRTRDNLAVAYADLDGFKGVNDRLGHAGGDQALVKAARALRKIARAGDVVARVGGDEFAILFVGSRPQSTRQLARRISTTLAAELKELGAGCSVGFSDARADDTPETLLARADAAMYEQKHRRVPAVSGPPAAVAVLATTRPETVLAIQRTLGQRGVALVPTASKQDVAPLVSLLKPRLVLADLLFPPRGGDGLLVELTRAKVGATLVLVMPQQGFAPGAWRETRWPVVTPAEADNRLGRILEKAVPRKGDALVPLESSAQAGEWLRAVHQLVTGARLSPERVAAVGRLAELDLLQRALGT